MTKLIPWRGFESGVKTRVGRGYIGTPAEFRVGFGGETVALPGGSSVQVDLTAAEADSALREIKAEFDRLKAEVAATDRFLAGAKSLIERTGIWKADYNSAYEMYVSELRSAIQAKTRGQDLIQKIKDRVNVVGGSGAVQRYGFGVLPPLAIAALYALAILASAGAVAVIGVGTIAEIIALFRRESAETARAREASVGNLQSFVKNAPHLTDAQKASLLKDIETLASRPVEVPTTMLIGLAALAFLLGGGSGFFMGRGTK